MKRRRLSMTTFAMLLPALAFAQAPPPSSYPQGAPPPAYPQGAPPPAYPQNAPPPSYPPQELDNLVSRIALYPDPLLSQVLAAATYPQDIPNAASWANEHSYLHGGQLAQAIQADQVPWDPSVQALLPFPSVLNMMAGDMNWTSQVGNAFLAEPDGVMDSVQRQRQEAMNFGYLRTNGQISVVASGGYVQILPVNPAFIPVPVYNPGVVFVRPRPGFFAGGAITFGGVTLGAAFAPWGWGHDSFDWRAHRVIINNQPWGRRWNNRAQYVHPYANVRRYAPAHRPVERHQVRGRGNDRGRDRDRN